LLGRRAERLRGVDRSDHEQARRRLVDVREDRLVPALEHAAAPRAEDLADLGSQVGRCGRLLALHGKPGPADVGPVHHGEQDGATLVLDDRPQALEQQLVGLVDEDVDLAAAGQADLQRHVVRDPEREQARLGAVEHLLRGSVDLVLDAAPRNGARQLSARRDAELGADRPRCGSARGDDGGDRNSFASAPPACDVSEDLLHR
jgi:hypothetical protein